MLLKIIAGLAAVAGGLLLKEGYAAWKAANFDGPIPVVLLLGGLLCLAGVLVPVFLDWRKTRREKEEKNILRKKQGEEAVRRLICSLGEAFENPPHVRANMMLLDRTRARRKVHSSTAFNMSSDPDHDLDINASVGVSGYSFLKKTWSFGDLTIAVPPGGAAWSAGMTASEIAKVKPGLKSILSVPIFDPSAAAEADGKRPSVGTLQVDSTLEMSIVFNDLTTSAKVITCFSDAIGVLLKAGGIAS